MKKIIAGIFLGAIVLAGCNEKKTYEVDIHDLAVSVIDKGLKVSDPGDYRGAGLHEGMAELALATGREDDMKRVVDTLLKYGRHEVALKPWNNFIIFDGGGLGTAMLCFNGVDTLKPQFLEMSERAWTDQPRTVRDNLMTAICKEESRTNDAVFIDIIGSTASFMMYAGQTFGNREWLDYGMMEGMALLNMFLDKETGLLHQGRGFGGKNWDELDSAFWSRGNGWGAKGMRTFVRDLDKNHPRRAEVEKFCHDYFTNVVKYQDENGMWHQEMTDPESYAEVSGTCYILMGMAACINAGVIDASYKANFEKGLLGVLSYVDPDGSVGHTCEGCLCPGDGSKDAYRAKPYWYNEDHACGPLVQMFASAISLGIDKVTLDKPLGYANEGDRFEHLRIRKGEKFQPLGDNYGLAFGTLFINDYVDGTADLGYGQSLSQKVSGSDVKKVKVTFGSALKRTLKFKMPENGKFSIKVNGKDAAFGTEDGYAVIKGDWTPSDKITLTIG